MVRLIQSKSKIASSYRPSNNQPVTGADLRAAIDAILAEKPVNPDQKPSIGCNIKWKSGNEPPPRLTS
ncbi:hypothetical protein [[Phormidium] sp. ETS-05]|uniref:hypothetical protein n=1 Tax=[Phormidium] sp. ETS-05 TaxID=222819 RepID=UPI0035C91AAB